MRESPGRRASVTRSRDVSMGASFAWLVAGQRGHRSARGNQPDEQESTRHDRMDRLATGGIGAVRRCSPRRCRGRLLPPAKCDRTPPAPARAGERRPGQRRGLHLVSLECARVLAGRSVGFVCPSLSLPSPSLGRVFPRKSARQQPSAEGAGGQERPTPTHATHQAAAIPPPHAHPAPTRPWVAPHLADRWLAAGGLHGVAAAGLTG